MYIKDTLTCREIVVPRDINFECVGVEVSLSQEMSFTIICVYRHPEAKIDFYDQFKSLLKSRDPKNEHIYLGDWNVNWDDNQSRKKS